MLKCGVYGSNGKMGKIIIKELESFADKVTLQECFTKEHQPNLTNLKEIELIIDFSTPKASLELSRVLEGTGILMICGTTGFTPNEMKQLKATKSTVLYSSNFSPSIKRIAKILKEMASDYKNYEVEILESHHSLKKDAPSGTALMLGEVIAKSRGQILENVKAVDRNHQRKSEEIGFASLRQGNVNGEHTVFFTSKGEQISIRHEAFNKNIFAVGAIQAGLNHFHQLKDFTGFIDFIDI